LTKTERIKAIEYWCTLIQESAARGDAPQAIVQLTGALSLWANQYAPTVREARAIYDIVEACKALFPIQPGKEMTFSEAMQFIELREEGGKSE
jgi:hypothetical protein